MVAYTKDQTLMPPRRRQTLLLVRTWAILLSFTLLALMSVYQALFQYYVIPTNSMANTLMPGYGIIVLRDGRSAGWVGRALNLSQNYRRGDIVVFYDPSNATRYLVKRVIGLPGEKLSITHTVVEINDKAIAPPSDSRIDHYFRMADRRQLLNVIREYQLTDLYEQDSTSLTLPLSPAQASAIRSHNGVIEFHVEEKRGHQWTIYSNGSDNDWNNDNYGPVVIPKAGLRIRLNAGNYYIYKKVIEDNEGRSTAIVNGQVYIDSVPVRSYIFKKDHYFLMGDNRNNSHDSRYFGFIPKDRLLGREVLKLSFGN